MKTSSAAPQPARAAPARVLGLRTATLLVAANIIGTGIFTTTGFLLRDLGSSTAVLALWTVGGLVALAGALCYAELSAAVPSNGADATLLGRIYHPALGFVASVVSLLVGFAGPVASTGLAFEAYLGPFLPAWMPVRGLGLGLILGLTALHVRSVSAGAAAQDAVTVPKLLLLVVFGGLGLALGSASNLGQGDTAGFGDAFTSSALPAAFIYVAYAYSGWNGAAYVAGEVVDPTRNVPRALVRGTLTVMAIYGLLNLAYLFAAPADQLAGRKDVAAAAATALGGPQAGLVVALLIAFGFVSAIGAWVLAGPRVIAETAASYPALSWIARRNAAGSPANAIVVQTAATLVFYLYSDLEGLLGFMGILLSLSSGLTVLGLIVLRVREPALPRPYRVPLYPLLPLLAGGVLLVMVTDALRQSPAALIGCGVTVGVSLVGYFGLKRGTPPPPAA